MRCKWTDQNTELKEKFLKKKKGGRETEIREEKFRYLAFISRVDINTFTQYAGMYSSKLYSKHELNILGGWSDFCTFNILTNDSTVQ